MEAFSAEADVAGGPSAAARARRLVEHQLSGRVPRRIVEDVALLVTELVANGVRHGGAVGGSSLHVSMEGRRPGLHVEVANPSDAPTAPTRRSADLDGGGGIGLNLVEQVASRWGVHKRPHTAVWFELDC